MNIAMFAWEALEGLSVGGGAVYASRLAAALARAGHRVRLFTRLGPGQSMDEVVDGIYVRRCPWDRKRNFIEEIESLGQAFVHYFADAMKTDGPYDVVHCHEWLTIGAGLRAMSICPTKLAVSFQSTEWGRTGIWPDHGDSSQIAQLERAGIERAYAVVAASHWAQRIVREQFHPPDWKCQVVYHGADLPGTSDPRTEKRIRESAGITPDTPSLLFAGKFSERGGGDLAARAVRLAASRFPTARFIFMGAGPLAESMREEAGPNAVFVPTQGRVVPQEYYRAVDLVLAPFRRDHNGRSVLAAWAAGRPVVALEDGVPAEFVLGDTNGWLIPEDPVELAAVIMSAFADRGRTAWMGQNGRVAAETAFTWDEAARRLLEAYERRDDLSPQEVEVMEM